MSANTISPDVLGAILVTTALILTPVWIGLFGCLVHVVRHIWMIIRDLFLFWWEMVTASANWVADVYEGKHDLDR